MTATRTLSAVERHPMYQRIIDAMVKNQSDNQICKWLQPSLDRTTLWRFRKEKLQDVLQRAAQVPATVAQSLQDLGLLKDGAAVSEAAKAVVAATSDILAADPLLSRIRAHRPVIDAKLPGAGAQGAAALINADLKGLELEAKLTGRLDAIHAGPQVNIGQIILLPKGGEPAAVEVGQVVEALPEPE